ncbi:MAG: signal peptidase I [Alphaproteobacteria bacterium]|nr:signal peptidase I [Alphaproteobacteria bacterium]
MSHPIVKSKSLKHTINTNLRMVALALLFALLIRSFAFQPFSIPSGSMLPTLLVGDYLFVAKYAYGFSRHSLPFSPNIFKGRLFAGDIKRGDVAVFKLPADGHTDYIKRVIGLPGDEIQLINGHVHINGRPVQRDLLPPPPNAPSPLAKYYRETLPNGAHYVTWDLGHKEQADNTRLYHVPMGHYFMMGDNRDNSLDSRFLDAVGYVPYENFIGRAFVKFYSFDDKTSFWEIWKWPTAIRWSRLFAAIE